MRIDPILISARAAALLGQGQSVDDVQARLACPDAGLRAACLKHGQDLLRRAPGLFRGRAGQIALRLLDAIDRLPARKRKVPLAAMFVAPVLIAFFVLQPLIAHYQSREWARGAKPECQVAQGLSNQLLLLQQDLGELPATPAGIARHAHAARESVRAAERDLGGLKVWGGPGSPADAAYRTLGGLSGSGLHAALVHDRPLLTDAQYQVARANSELTLARELAATSNAWQNVGDNLPADLPADLVPAWDQAAARLQVGLQSGDVNAVNAAVASLKALQHAGSLDQAVSRDQSALPAAAASVAAPLAATIHAAIAHGNAAGARAGLATLNALVDRVQSTYVLRFADHAGIDTGVVRKDEQTGRTACYVMLEAFSPQGAPISIPVHNDESSQWVVTHTYGVQIPLAQYRSLMDKKATGELPAIAGTKPAGSLRATYAFPAMGGRITAS